MKVLHICNNFLGSRVHQEMADASRALGISNTVFAPVVLLSGRVTPHENEYVRQCVRSADRYFYLRKQAKTYRCLRETLSPVDFDLVHTHCVFTDGNVALRLKREYGIPYLVTVNNTDLNHFFRLRRFLRGRGLRIMREAACIVFITEPYCRRVFEKYVPRQYQAEFREKTRIIPFGIDGFWFENAVPAPRTLGEKGYLRLIFAGDICENKNLKLLLEAVELLHRNGREVSLTVAGKALDPELVRTLRESGPHIAYVGLLSKEELLTYYRQADLFVMPSHKETFGLVYAEAMSQGLPVLYTRGQGFDGQFPDGTVGYAVSDTDPRELAEKIGQAADNYEALSANCVRLVEKFRWASIAKQYQEIYQTITERK